jgi:hypothetical protein
MTLIQENEKAMLWQTEHGFETWIRRTWSVKSKAGQLIIPEPEDFGIIAWSHYTLEAAQKSFHEITTGKRTIRPMLEIESE